MKPFSILLFLFLALPLARAEAPHDTGKAPAVPAREWLRRKFPAAEKFFCPAPRKAKPKINTSNNFPVLAHEGQTKEVMITGEALYPTAYVLANLGFASLITPEQREFLKIDLSKYKTIYSTIEKPETLAPILEDLKGMKILSIAEGYSGLLPFLAKHGAHVTGADLAYGADVPEAAIFSYLIKQYQKKFEKTEHTRLAHADAAALPAEFHGAFDRVVMHKLLNNIPELELKQKMVEQAFLALKPGGIASLTAGDADTVEETIQKVKTLLARLPPDSYDLVLQNGTIEVTGAPGPEGKSYPYDSFPADEYKKYMFHPPDLSTALSPRLEDINPPFCELEKEALTVTIVKKKK